MKTFFDSVLNQFKVELDNLERGLSPEDKVKFNTYKQGMVKIIENDEMSMEEKIKELNKIKADANTNI